MVTERESEIFKQAVSKWGKDLQILIAIEEMAELTKALTKWFRGDKNTDNIIEEMADVDIMIGQLKYLFDSLRRFSKAKKQKLDRLEKMLETDEKDE